MSDPLDQLRAERVLRERRARRAAAVAVSLFVVIAIGGIVLFEGVIWDRSGVAVAAANPPAAKPADATHSAAARDASAEQTLQDATGLAASLLASTQSTEVARSALVAAQQMTGCTPKEGGPSLVHVGNDAEKAAELASRSDFYATAEENGREYATHAQVYEDRRTIVHVAVAWECSPQP